MNQILIVDDDADQLRLLARAISVRGDGMKVLTAADGSEAIARLEMEPIDLVLTDLQMPEMNGFDLLAWLLSNQPHVTVFTMTAFYDDDAVQRLTELGDVECFVKPLDVSSVYARLAEVLEGGVQGQIKNISLASLLQLVEMERKTCTLRVSAGDRVGQLFVREGAIVHALGPDGEGEREAIRIASWKYPAITIASGCRADRQTVDRPTGFIVMEAMRLLDEQARDSMPAQPPSADDPFAGWGDDFASEPPPARVSSVPPRRPRSRSLSMFPASSPSNAEAIFLVDSGGRVRNRAGEFPHVEEVGELAAEMYRLEIETIERLGLDDEVEEIVISGSQYWVLARPLDFEPGHLVVGVFDPDKVTLVMERVELERFMSVLETWSKQAEPSAG